MGFAWEPGVVPTASSRPLRLTALVSVTARRAALLAVFLVFAVIGFLGYRLTVVGSHPVLYGDTPGAQIQITPSGHYVMRAQTYEDVGFWGGKNYFYEFELYQTNTTWKQRLSVTKNRLAAVRTDTTDLPLDAFTLMRTVRVSIPSEGDVPITNFNAEEGAMRILAGSDRMYAGFMGGELSLWPLEQERRRDAP